MTDSIHFSFEEMWEKIMACDRKYDGLFYTAVKTTKIYCRPSCRSRKPKKQNVEFYYHIQAAETAGYRACKRCQPETEKSPEAALVHDVILFLAKNYKQRLQLKDISDHVGISTFYLERVFKKETEETPRTYLDRIRTDKAAYLLKHTAMTNLDICHEAGFHSPSNYYKIFRRLKGCSPSEFRNEGALPDEMG
ncbi:AraC family transcriptional regulator [Metabacillus sp. GX 13764]|uniref:bifunctional transcriptional activator/DNA repair enzyme AdaA n=1 Tax=Metabacillus kandeliae TaxID=2900151 RepID=UPI001E50F5BD|nr:Ada metal-binding domain-containing protein [Metabacillus kandeliae]MCD7034074.1 AraC family transcriptional regulator [Metabacillus kandeliae]